MYYFSPADIISKIHFTFRQETALLRGVECGDHWLEVTKKSLGYWGITISEAGIETLGSSMGTLPRTLGKTGRCQTHFWTSQNACYPRNTLANASKDG